MFPRFVIACLVVFFFLLPESSGAGIGFREKVAPLLEFYCFDCHNAKKKKGQIRLDDLAGFEGGDSHLWTKIYEEITRGKMPPEDKERFSKEEEKEVLDWIVSSFEKQADSEHGTRRRLNRREFAAALQELTGVAVAFGAGLAADGKVEGFDTGAEGLKDTAETVAQMLEVTRRAVDGIRFLEPEREGKLEIDFREHDFTDFRKWVDKSSKKEGVFTRSEGLVCRSGTGLYLPTAWSGDRENSFLALPAPLDKSATLLIRLKVKAVRPLPVLPQPMLWVKVGGKYLDYQAIPDEGRTLEYAVRMEDCLVEDGVVKVMLRSVVEMPYAVAGFPNDDRSKPGEVPGGIGVYRPNFDRKKLRSTEDQPVPVTVVESVMIDYDHCAKWPPASWGVLEEEVTDSEESALALLKLWTARAWRRPVEESEVAPYLKLYRKLRSDGMIFDAALRPAFQSVLMTPGFRDHSSPAEEGFPQFAMASRLSFMLTGRPPDGMFRELAEKGELYEPGVLEAQIERLITDERSRGFFEPFVTQWLVMDQPITVTMTHLQKQDFRFGRHLKASMKEETVEYVRLAIAENRPAAELVSSDWTVLNDILALHYGIPGVEGAHMRKVDLTDSDDPRGGGIPGHAGIQSMLTWMGDNWVIYRGAWFLHHILDDPPPPAPLEVPELNPSEGENRGKSFREVLAHHLADTRCASCHEDMDPLGFAFQNFDLSGRWRDQEFHHYARKEIDGKIEWRGAGESRPVDAVGRLPRGEKFSGYLEFKEQLAAHYLDDIVRGLLKRLTLFGTGRSPNVLDLRVIDEIMASHRETGFRLRDLLADLATSPIFLDHRTIDSLKK